MDGRRFVWGERTMGIIEVILFAFMAAISLLGVSSLFLKTLR